MRALLAVLILAASRVSAAVPQQPYVWKNVTVVAGGFVPGIVFSPVQKGLIYARTDIGGAYRYDAASSRWSPLNDWVGPANANYMGVESVAPDPVDPNVVYLAVGTYSTGPAAILRSLDQGRTFAIIPVPFTMGGNENGRGVGERLAVDPNDTRVLYFASRRDGLWRSGDRGATWKKVDSLAVPASPAPARGGFGGGSDTGAGLSFVIFDRSSGRPGSPTPGIYVGSAIRNFPTLFHSADSGQTWKPVPGAPKDLLAHHGQLDSAGMLFISLADTAGPNNLSRGAVWKLNIASGAWTNITPEPGFGGDATYGYGGLAIDAEHPGTLLVATLNRWQPGDDIFRSTDGGKTYSSLRDHSLRDASLSPYLIWGDPAPSFGWWFAAAAIDPFDSNHALYGTGATVWGTQDLTQLDAAKTTHWSVAAAGIEETAVLDLASPPAGPHLFSALGDIGGYRHDDLSVSPPAGMFTNPMFNNTNSIDFAELHPDIVIRSGAPKARQPYTSAYSLDGGVTWTPLRPPAAANAGPGFGRGAYSDLTADGKTFLASAGVGWSFSRDHGATWAACGHFPRGGRPTPDRADPLVVYAVSDQTLFVSNDGGQSFAASKIAGIPDFSAGQRPGRLVFIPRPHLRTVPGRRGELWLFSGQGLFHLAAGAQSFVKVPAVESAAAIGFGKPAGRGDYPAIYLSGSIAGLSSLFRSDDTGQTWVRITDDAHQYGALPNSITGDPRVYGRLYIGTNGRGILYGDPAK